MKKLFRIFMSLVLALIFCFQAANACTISIPSLRKEFRKADSVFIGKVVSIQTVYSPTESEASSIPEDFLDVKGLSKVTFDVKGKWKGGVSGRREFISIAFDVCGCPGAKIDTFVQGEELLVFAAGRNFVWICDSYKPNEDWAKGSIKKLDEFWFRVWARIYPF